MFLLQSGSLLQSRAAPLAFQKTSRMVIALLGLSMLADVMPLWRLSYEEQLKPVIDGYRNKSIFSVN